jgi:toxin ParE1/3/4
LGEARIVKLRFTPQALTELAEILDYLAERSPQGTRRVQERIQTITTLLVRHPYAGQVTSKPRARRISVAPYPFVIFYEVTDEEIIIVAVRHTSRDPASNLG